MTALAHSHDLPVIYHGCGNMNALFEDFIEIGVDAINPLEVKAGMDVQDLRERYGHRDRRKYHRSEACPVDQDQPRPVRTGVVFVLTGAGHAGSGTPGERDALKGTWQMGL